jgi:hypothetical protein
LQKHLFEISSKIHTFILTAQMYPSFNSQVQRCQLSRLRLLLTVKEIVLYDKLI